MPNIVNKKLTIEIVHKNDFKISSISLSTAVAKITFDKRYCVFTQLASFLIID